MPPESEAKRLYGVVVEVGLDEGLDIVAAYEDHLARYGNYSGAGIVWERPDGLLDAAIETLLQAGRVVVEQIGPWEEARPGPPPNGSVRLNFLTPSGLHFGQAAMDVFWNDPMAGPTLRAAFALMQALIAQSDAARAGGAGSPSPAASGEGAGG